MANYTSMANTLNETLTDKGFLEELIKAMSQEEFDECCKYIARMHDIEIEDGWDEEEVYNSYLREDERQTAHELWE